MVKKDPTVVTGGVGSLPPPDGGWGWVVVFASFMIHVIADGVTYTFGIFYYEFLKYFGESKGTTAWVASIMVGTTYCIGPIASGLTNKYGCRAVTIAGAVLAAIGLMLSIIAPNVPCLFFTIGLCTGSGFGLMYLPSIVSVTCYFEKQRAFATGMAVCGSGMGTFALAPLTECLVESYGWKGAMLIISGLVLNCAVFGALFRPLEDFPRPKETPLTIAKKVEVQLPCKNGKITNGYASGPEDVTNTTTPLIAARNGEAINTAKDNVDTLKRDIKPTNGYLVLRDLQRGDISPMRNSLTIPDGYSINTSTSLSDRELELIKVGSEMSNGHAISGITENGKILNGLVVPLESKKDEISPLRSTVAIPSDFLRRKVEGTPLSSFICSSASLAQTNKELSQLESISQPHSGGILYRKDIFYSGSLLNISKYRSHPNICYSSVTLSDNRSSRIEKRAFWCCPQEVRDALFEMTDFSLLKNPVFLMFGISNFLTNIGFNVPYVYTKDRVAELGIASNEDASFLLAIIGISNTVGRVTLGYLSDRACVNRLYVYNVSLMISGLATVLSCYAVDYNMMAAYCVTFGATAGAYVSLTSVILVDLLGLDKLTNAFGLLLVFEGVSCLLGPPITGWLYDGLGSYDPGFYVSGTMIAISGLMLFLVPCVANTAANRHLVPGQEDNAAKTKAVDLPA